MKAVYTMGSSYSDKLKHPKWQKMRLKVLQRDKFTCQLCGDKETELHIHHKEYRKQWTDPWEYPVDQLTCLCKHCHYVVSDLELNMNVDMPGVYKRITPLNKGSIFLAIIYSDGLWIYEGDKLTITQTLGLKHGVIKDLVHGIINYWLRTENEQYLQESKPGKTNINAEKTN